MASSTKLPSGFTMRLADVRDRAAVIAVSYDEYFINDYIPVVFDNWIRRNNTFIYLLEYKEKVVCFEAVEVDVFDKCMIMLESCINKEIRSQNIYLPFHIAVIYDLRKTFPWLNVAMGTSMHVEFFESRLGYDSPYKVALKWESMEWEVKLKDLHERPPISGHVQMLDDRLAIQTLQNPRVMKKFFPSGLCTMHLEWYPMEVTERNMERLAKANNIVVTKTTCANMYQGHSGQNEPIAMSLSQIILLPCGEMYTIFFHGDKMADFKDHVIYQLDHFEKIRNPTLHSYCQLNFPLTFTADSVKSEMESFFSRFLWSGGAVTNVTNLNKYLASKQSNNFISSKL